jgi:hypothetical protein
MIYLILIVGKFNSFLLQNIIFLMIWIDDCYQRGQDLYSTTMTTSTSKYKYKFQSTVSTKWSEAAIIIIATIAFFATKELNDLSCF